ncbi:MAG: hypothetical protein AB4368_18720 [Xenococcaceae cyanobacterium]
MSEQSDPELIFLALQGDKTAFGKLVWRYQPMAQNIAVMNVWIYVMKLLAEKHPR